MRDLSLREKRDQERVEREGERELEWGESAYLAATTKAIMMKATATNAGGPLP